MLQFFYHFMDSEYRFCFTLDTEPDDLWARRPALSFEHFNVLPGFHDLIVESGGRPTYLTTSEVAESARGRGALEACLARGDCEIGVHFHTWTRAWPFPVANLGDPPVHALAHQLGQEVEERMIEFTKRSILGNFGVEAESYRGGRWSLGPSSVKSLVNCGISVDSTVTPGLSWADAASPLVDGPDFRYAQRGPHWLTFQDRAVVELPVGAAWFPEHLQRVHPWVQKQARRVSARTHLRVGHRWLRPTRVSVPDMTAVMRKLKAQGIKVWVIMIHSAEIVPCTPLPTREAVEAFKRRCAGVVRAAVELGASPATLTEAARWWEGAAAGSCGSEPCP